MESTSESDNDSDYVANYNPEEDDSDDDNTGSETEEDDENCCPYLINFHDTMCSIVPQPITFATDGVLERPPLPGLYIKDVGDISLPLCESQAKEIIEMVKDNSDDPSVEERNSWEIKSNQLALESEKFEMTWKKKIIQKVIAELGCKASEEVTVSTPRAVLYGKGASIDLTSDDEDKESVTLIVQLPSVFTGNNLTIHHDEDSKIIKFDEKYSKFEIIYGAFYSNCEYELSTLKSGYRLVLVYKLTWNDCKIPQSRIDESKEATQKVKSALSQLYQNREKYFGWMFEEKWDPDTIESGSKSLKGIDCATATYLEWANKELPEDEQFSFYLVTYEKRVTKKGYNKFGHYSLEHHREVCEEIDLKEGVDMQTMIKYLDFSGLPIDIKNDLLQWQKGKGWSGVWTKPRRKTTIDWGQAVSKRIEDHWTCYTRTVLLAVPTNRRFEYFCLSKNPTQCVQFLKYNVDSQSENYKKLLKELLEKFTADDFNCGKNTHYELAYLFVNTWDPEMSFIYIDKIMAGTMKRFKTLVYGVPPGCEEPVAKIIQSVPWEKFKETYKHILENIVVKWYPNVMKIYELTGIVGIMDMLIEQSLKMFSKDRYAIQLISGSDPANPYFWEEVFEFVCNNDELYETWFEKFANHKDITSSLSLMSRFFNEMHHSDRPQSSKSRILNLFIDCIKQSDDLVTRDDHTPQHFEYDEDDDKASVGKPRHGISLLIASTIYPLLEKSDPYKEELTYLCDYLISSNYSVIISRILIGLIEEGQPASQTGGFKMIYGMYMSRLIETNLKASQIEEIVNIAEILLRSAEYNGTNKSNYEAICKSFKEPHLLYKLAVNLFQCSRVLADKKSDFNDVINYALKLFLESLETKSMSCIHPLSEFLVFLVENVTEFENVLTKMLSNAKIIPEIKDCSYDIVYSLAKKPQRTGNFKKLVSIVISAIADWLDRGGFPNQSSWCSFTYDKIRELMKMLASDKFFTDIQVVFLQQFQVIGQEKLKKSVTSRKAILDKLLIDFQNEEFQTNLLKARLKNLESLREEGCPKFSWKQPNADIEEHNYRIREFLGSDEVTFIYRNLHNITEAKEWIKRHAGVHENCSFSAIAREVDGKVEVVLQKGQEIYEKTKKEYFDLISELEELEAKVQASSCENTSNLDAGCKKPKKARLAFKSQKEE
ncbi:uncharacterized protein [Clytia hemisphaerica]|uniref:Uncharacterized protein n=1 Tax=Clytia hemisphaerica TaxID=252671 RepID=A0A7M5XFC8_9CNID